MKLALDIILGLILVGVLAVFIFHVRNYKKTSYPRITYISWLPAPRRAMTIPPFGIFTKKEYQGQAWSEKHEDVHWDQYKKLGLWGFYFQYYKGFIMNGYFNDPMEKEARKKGGWRAYDTKED